MRGSPTSSGDLLSLEPATHQIHNSICSHSSTVSKRQSALCSLPVLLLCCRSGRATLKTACRRLDRHVSFKQVNIGTTLSSIVASCSRAGKEQNQKEATNAREGNVQSEE